MPKPPRFQSPRLRQFVISTAMTLLLAFALLLALAFSTNSPATNFAYSQNGHTYQYRHLQFTLPADWQPLPPNEDDPFGNSQITLLNQLDPLKTLTIGVLPSMRMRSPAIAMEEAHELLLGGLEDRPLIQTRLRHETATGLLHVSLTPIGKLSDVATPSGEMAVGIMNHLMVFSTNAREYVVIYHAHNTDYDRSTIARTQQRLGPAIQLVMTIANLTKNTQYTLATHDDYVAAGLPVAATKHASHAEPSKATDPNANKPVDTKNNTPSLTLEMPWRIFKNDLGTDDDSLYLLPHAGPPMFWAVRLLGTITPTSRPATEAATPATLSTSATPDGSQLLAYVQANYNDDLKADSQIIPLTTETFQGWKLVTTTPATASSEFHDNTNVDATVSADVSTDIPAESPADPTQEEPTLRGDGLVRELWFVPMGHQRALVAQIIAEPEALPHATRQLINAINLQISAAGQAATTLHDNWQQAVQRGEKIVTEIRNNVLASQKPGLTYGVLRIEEMAFGLTLTQTVVGDDALPIRGRETAFVLTTPSYIYEDAWSGDAQLTRLWMTTQKRDLNLKTLRPVPSTDTSDDSRKELVDNKLTRFEIKAAGKQTVPKWTQQTTANFLPQIALFRLNADVLKSLADQPEAMVMYARSDNPPEPCWLGVKQIDNHWRLTLRPTADIDPTTIWYDEQGTAREFYWTNFYPNHGGSMRFSNIATDRQRILNAFKYLKPQIIAWEKEWQPDE